MAALFNVVPKTTVNGKNGTTRVLLKGLRTRDLTGFDDEHQARIFDEMLAANIPNIETSIFSISINYKGIKEPISTGFRRREVNNGQSILQKLAILQQSNNFVKADENLEIEIIVIENALGPKLNSKGVLFKRPNGKKGERIPYVRNFNDALCLPRAVAIAFAHGGMLSLLQKHNVSAFKDLPEPEKKLFLARKKLFTFLTDAKNLEVDDRQKIYAEELLQQCGIPLDKPFYNEEDLKAIYKKRQSFPEHINLHYSPFSFHVFNFEGDWEYSIQDEEHFKDQIPLLFLHYEDHMDFTIDLRHADRIFCHLCNLSYHVDRRHYCQRKCFLCNDHVGECKPVAGEGRRCGKCHFYFNNKECYEAHLKTSPHGPNTKATLCTQRHRCVKEGGCGKAYRVDKANPHDCSVKYCGKCKEKREIDHVCSWKKITETEKKVMLENCKEFKNVLFDFETMQNDIKENDEVNFFANGHVPIWVGAISVCHECQDKEIDPDGENICKNCGGERVFERIYDPNDPEKCHKSYVIDEFVKHFFCQKRYDGATLLAHNASGFDSVPILQKLMSMGVAPAVLHSGTRILQMTIAPRHYKTSRAMAKARWLGKENPAVVTNPIKATVNIKDSWLFTMCPLSSFSKTFDLETMKGEFPYLLISDKYWDLDQKGLPDKKWYEPELKSEEAAKEFNEWYEKNKEKHFNLVKELRSYGINDVRLLLNGFLKLRKIFIEYCKFDPFVECVTLASTAQLAFRLNHLKDPSIIAHLDERGEPLSDNQSILALRYLLWFEKKKNEERKKLGLPPLMMQTAAEGGEKRFMTPSGKTYKIDGWWEEEDGKCFGIEVQGCWWHGCPHCACKLEDEDEIEEAEARFASTHSKINELEAMGIEVRQVWEHEINVMLESDREMKRFFEENVHKERLFPRNAYYGGRTFTSQLIMRCDEGQELAMGDFNSLYPSVMKQESYPKGKYESTKKYGIYGRHIPLPPPGEPLPYKGLIQCKIVVPKDCPLSVLPFKTNKQLYFGNCAKCIQTESTRRCQHTDKDKEFIGVWTHIDINDAISLGAKVTDIWEVWNWFDWSEPGELFGDFVKTFYKLKVANSGWGDKKTPEVRKAYLEGLKEKDGIDLKEEEIKENKALRFLAKIMLNSMYGKFGERVNRDKTEYLWERSKILEITQNPKLKVTSRRWIPSTFEETGRDDESILMITYHTREEFEHSPSFGNLAIAAFITSYGRHRLHQVCHAVGEAHLYSDTDSIAYRKTPEAEEALKPFIHPYLGGLDSEVKEGWKMTDFVAPSAKCYGYRQVKRDDSSVVKDTLKIRGIRLHTEAKSEMSFDNFHDHTYNYITALRQEVQVPLETESREELQAKRPVTAEGLEVHQFRQRQFMRDNHRILTKESRKKLNLNQHKGIIDLYTTRVKPFGYVPSLKRPMSTSSSNECKKICEEYDPVLLDFM